VVETHTPEEIADVIKPSFPDSDKETLITVAKRYKETMYGTKTYIEKESLDLLQEVMSMAGELKKEAPYEK